MPTILIIDDQRCIRELLSEELSDDGYQVKGAGDVRQARHCLEVCRPDLVLLDLFLEGPDGWEVLREIKDARPELPVVIYTAYDTFEDDPRLIQADGYVIKSTDLGGLKEKITAVLGTGASLGGAVDASGLEPVVELAAPLARP
ncbi:MAG: response regulator [Deltaproteobacteria bacterium]|nr:response regulator [Deltaproteobacteria bacterium]